MQIDTYVITPRRNFGRRQRLEHLRVADVALDWNVPSLAVDRQKARRERDLFWYLNPRNKKRKNRSR